MIRIKLQPHKNNVSGNEAYRIMLKKIITCFGCNSFFILIFAKKFVEGMLNPKYRLKYQAEQAYWENLNENLLEFSSALEFSSNRFDSSRYDFKGISQFSSN